MYYYIFIFIYLSENIQKWNENFLRFYSFFPVLLVKNMIKYKFYRFDTVLYILIQFGTVFSKNFVYF